MPESLADGRKPWSKLPMMARSDLFGLALESKVSPEVAARIKQNAAADLATLLETVNDVAELDLKPVAANGNPRLRDRLAPPSPDKTIDPLLANYILMTPPAHMLPPIATSME